MKPILAAFLFFLAVFFVIQFHPFLDLNLPDWVVFYVKDFICMPIVLTICLVVVQLIHKNKDIRLSLFTVFSLALFYSLYFELYLPRFHFRYTADILDVLMYFLGSLVFYFLQQKPKKEETS